MMNDVHSDFGSVQIMREFFFWLQDVSLILAVSATMINKNYDIKSFCNLLMFFIRILFKIVLFDY